jgi:imidazole glycerol phosphate synthase glutamine amidotransferase subunit
MTPGCGTLNGPDAAVIQTGTANMASIMAGLRRAGAAPRPAIDPLDVLNAAFAVLPGVGSFGAAMQRLRADGMVEALRERIARRRPLLAICAGMQVLAAASEESPRCEGIGIVESTVRRYRGDVRVPQIGWNRVSAGECTLLTGGCAYFANSYRLAAAPTGAVSAMSEYGGPFVAAFEMAGGSLLACQFHPELSGAWGLELLRRWMDGHGGAAC